MIRTLISSLMVIFGLFVGMSQWFAIWTVTRKQRENPESSGYSMVPLIGGLIGTIGCLISPFAIVSAMWWIPPIIDPGCVLMCSLLIGVSLRSCCQRLINQAKEE